MGTKAVVGNMSVQSYCPLQKILIFTGWFIVSYFTSNIHFMFNGSLETRTKDDDDDDDQNMNIKMDSYMKMMISLLSSLFLR